MKYKFIILFSYKYIIRIPIEKKVRIFHTSDLLKFVEFFFFNFEKGLLVFPEFFFCLFVSFSSFFGIYIFLCVYR